MRCEKLTRRAIACESLRDSAFGHARRMRGQIFSPFGDKRLDARTQSDHINAAGENLQCTKCTNGNSAARVLTR